MIFCHLLTLIKSMNTIKVSNSLDINQDLHCVGPHLGPNGYEKNIIR